MMKLNNRGQSLVEFVLILPIVILVLLSIIDIGKIIYQKNVLQNKIDEAVDLLKSGKSYEDTLKEINDKNVSNINLSIIYTNDKYVTITTSSNIVIITPGMNAILGNPYQLKESRKVYYNNE